MALCRIKIQQIHSVAALKSSITQRNHHSVETYLNHSCVHVLLDAEPQNKVLVMAKELVQKNGCVELG